MRLNSCLSFVVISATIGCFMTCDHLEYTKSRIQFYLLKSHHRSQADRLFVANVNSLESCMNVARSYKGLALNYSPRERRMQREVLQSKTYRDHYWQQPQIYFNCHILQSPENSTFSGLIKDNQFDYYSVYEKAIAIPNYICVPEVGIFVLHDTFQTFENASLLCQTISDEHCGSLANIISAPRTIYLQEAMANYNKQQTYLMIKPKIHLAYVGLYFNRSRQHQRFEIVNMQGDKLKCFRYRAWEPGNPKISSQFQNASCVALTSHGTWLTVDCKRNLPFICEVHTQCNDEV